MSADMDVEVDADMDADVEMNIPEDVKYKKLEASPVALQALADEEAVTNKKTLWSLAKDI